MSAANANGLHGRRPPARTNGAGHSAKIAVQGVKRGKRMPGAAGNAAPEARAFKKVAEFASPEVRAAAGEAWPVRPAAWLQRELSPLLPAAGLAIARIHSLPPPDFLPAEDMRESSLARFVAPGFLPARIASRLPADDLSPAGWDPRAAGLPAEGAAGSNGGPGRERRDP